MQDAFYNSDEKLLCDRLDALGYQDPTQRPNVFLANYISACSFSQIPFCNTVSEYNDDRLIVSGYITAVDMDGINFEIIDLING